VIEKNERLILYNAVFMQQIAQQTKEYWSQVAILAHEVGHHVRFHTVIDGRNHEFELEADYQAGFILRRMGATLEQAQAAFRSIGTVEATDSHPALKDRLQAVTLGWTEGGSPPARSGPQPASLETGAVPSGLINVDFSAGEKGQAPRYLVVADPYLRANQIPISIDKREPPESAVVFVNNLGLYTGRAVAPTVSQNFLTQIETGNVPASFTMRFAQPVQSVTFLVPKVYPATASGVTFPAWQAVALGPNGEKLGSVSEGLTRRFADVPARSHKLSAPAFEGIAAIRFESDPNLNGRPFAGFSTILIEQILIEPRTSGR
jgi:hypothetical protein